MLHTAALAAMLRIATSHCGRLAYNCWWHAAHCARSPQHLLVLAAPICTRLPVCRSGRSYLRWAARCWGTTCTPLWPPLSSGRCGAPGQATPSPLPLPCRSAAAVVLARRSLLSLTAVLAQASPQVPNLQHPHAPCIPPAPHPPAPGPALQRLHSSDPTLKPVDERGVRLLSEPVGGIGLQACRLVVARGACMGREDGGTAEFEAGPPWWRMA